MTPREVLDFAKKEGAQQVDVRFTDIPSLQHHISYPIKQLTEDSFEEGYGIDGSSIRGWVPVRCGKRRRSGSARSVARC